MEIETRQDVKGVIGMACGTSARYSDTYASLMDLEKPEGWIFRQKKGMSVADNFNSIARLFLNTTAEWLFLVNDDHVWAPTALKSLLAHDKDVVTGLYLARTLPCAPVVFDQTSEDGRIFPFYLQKGQRGLVPIKACGDGCLLIRRRVLEAIPDPWWELGIPETDKCGHDVLFSKKVCDAGFQIYCDMEVTVGHIGMFAIFPYRDADGNWQTFLINNGHTLGIPPAAVPRNPYSMTEGA